MAALLSAIMRAIKGIAMAMLYAVDWALMWPFRLFGPPSGRSAIEAPPEITDSDQSLTASHTTPDADHSRAVRREAAAAVVWCEGKVIHRDSVAAPGNAISQVTAAWLASLRMREIEAVIKAGYIGLSRHISGQGFIDGVPALNGTRRRQRPESLFKDSSTDDVRLIVGHSI